MCGSLFLCCHEITLTNIFGMKYVFKNQKVYILFKLSQTGSLTHYLCQTGTILSCLLKENDNTFKVENE